MHKNKGGDERGRSSTRPMGRNNQNPHTKDQELDSNDLRTDMREIYKRIELLGLNEPCGVAKVGFSVSSTNEPVNVWRVLQQHRTRRGGKVVGDAAGVRWGGGAPSPALYGGERRDVRTFKAVRTSVSETDSDSSSVSAHLPSPASPPNSSFPARSILYEVLGDLAGKLEFGELAGEGKWLGTLLESVEVEARPRWRRADVRTDFCRFSTILASATPILCNNLTQNFTTDHGGPPIAISLAFFFILTPSGEVWDHAGEKKWRWNGGEMVEIRTENPYGRPHLRQTVYIQSVSATDVCTVLRCGFSSVRHRTTPREGAPPPQRTLAASPTTFHPQLFSYDMEGEEGVGEQEGGCSRWKDIITFLWREELRFFHCKKEEERIEPPKKQRLPLSIARVVMKKQKDREQKQLQENVILGRFGGKSRGGSKRSVEKRRPEDRVLRASEGYFKNGVLDVKHLLRPTSSRDRDGGAHVNFTGPKKGGGKNKGKKGGKKRH
ncbi:hypothetical protein ACLB2K_022562 [Fragaria x ananassa]